MLRRFGSSLVLFSVSLAGCTPVPIETSSTILLSEDESTLFVSSPDDDAVVEIDAETLQERKRFPVAGEPEQLLRMHDGRLLVSLGRAPELVRLDPVTGEQERASLPCGRSFALVRQASRVFVSCPDDNFVLELNQALEVVARLSVERGPSALIIHRGALWVGQARGGGLLRFTLPDLGRATATPLSPAAGISPSQIDAVTGGEGDVPIFAYQEVAHDDDRSRPAGQGGYGSVSDGAPRIQPRLTGPCRGSYAAFDGSERVLSGPSALVYHAATGLTWVAHRLTDNVIVLRCGTNGEALLDDGRQQVSLEEQGLTKAQAVFRVGRGPRGLALTSDGETAFVDEGFAHALSRLRLPAEDVVGRWSEPDLTQTRRLGDTRFSDDALRGRSLFHDANNTQLTPSGVVACATCHPRGQEDGLTWFLNTPGISRRLRRTQAAWGGGEALLPAHWDGAFLSAQSLALSTIRELMDGEALLVDVDAMAKYLTASRPPPPRPLANSEEAAAAERGKALFESAAVGCSGCHQGAYFSDGQRYDTPPRTTDLDAQLVLATTPPLRGVRARAPYLHDGRAATLLDVITRHNPNDRHGRTSTLSTEERTDLVHYLESL